jgi:hypothetical protein
MVKKYYCTETDEEIMMGDIFHLTLTKECENGKVTVEKEIDFNDATKDYLIDMGFIYEREEPIDFDEPGCSALEQLIKDFEDHDMRLEQLEKSLDALTKMVSSLQKSGKKGK